MRKFIGIDFGGTGIAGAIVSEDGKIIAREEVSTPKSGGSAIFEAGIALIKQLLKAGHQVEGVGVAAGGQIDTENGVVLYASPIMPGWTGTKIAQGIKNEFGLNCKATNDVKGMAVGECRFGAGRQLTRGSIVCLALGTGVGGALVIDGVPYDGASFLGGHFGHMIIDPSPNARRGLGCCRGALEAYCSSAGLVQTWRDLTGRTDERFTSEDVVAAARADEQGPAGQAIKRTGETLGVALASLASILAPHMFIIGGGLSEIGEPLLGPARRTMGELAHHQTAAACPLVTADLGADAQIIGAAALMMEPDRVAAPV